MVVYHAQLNTHISTHTSRVGCDSMIPSYLICLCLFLLTHPVWDVTCPSISGTLSESFLLTHPVWDVTDLIRKNILCENISTHTSRVGCDLFPLKNFRFLLNFYSHIPCGMWLKIQPHCTRSIHFYSHIPCGMWLGIVLTIYRYPHYFYSHIPCGMWHRHLKFSSTYYQFLLTHPVWDVTWLFPNNVHQIWFLLTHPVWDVTLLRTQNTLILIISTHTSRVGCD